MLNVKTRYKVIHGRRTAKVLTAKESRSWFFTNIARELASKPCTIFDVIRLGGGYSPPQHTRNKQHLTLLESEGISRGIAQGSSIRNIASKLNQPPQRFREC